MKSLSIAAMTAVLLMSGTTLTFAQSDGTNDICSSVTSDVATGAEQIAAIQAATTATVIELDGCTGAPDPAFIEAMQANEAIARVLQQDNVGAGEIIAFGIEETTVTVYVGADETD